MGRTFCELWLKYCSCSLIITRTRIHGSERLELRDISLNNKLTSKRALKLKPLQQSLNVCRSATSKRKRLTCIHTITIKERKTMGFEKANDGKKLKAKKEVVGVFREGGMTSLVGKKVTPGFLITQSIFCAWNKFYIRRSSQLFYYSTLLTERTFLQVKQIKESVTK